MIINSQVHAYEANTPKRPWHSVPNWPPHVTGDEMVAAMDKVGVDGAIFISAFSLYQYDASYAIEVQKAHPGRMAIIKPVNPDDPAVADVIAEWKKQPGAVAIRIMIPEGTKRPADDPGLGRIARAAAQNDLPLNMLCWGNLDVGTALIDRYPDTRFIIDHLGIMQPRVPPAPDEALGRPAEGARHGEAQERRDQGERRLHALEGAVSLQRHLGSAAAHLRRLGLRALPLGHGLDARGRGRQLRAGREAVPGDEAALRSRARHADGRRLREGVSVGAEALRVNSVRGAAAHSVPSPPWGRGLAQEFQ